MAEGDTYTSRTGYKEGGEIPVWFCHVTLGRDYRNSFLQERDATEIQEEGYCSYFKIWNRGRPVFNLGNKIRIFTVTLLSRSVLLWLFHLVRHVVWPYGNSWIPAQRTCNCFSSFGCWTENLREGMFLA